MRPLTISSPLSSVASGSQQPAPSLSSIKALTKPFRRQTKPRAPKNMPPVSWINLLYQCPVCPCRDAIVIVHGLQPWVPLDVWHYQSLVWKVAANIHCTCAQPYIRILYMQAYSLQYMYICRSRIQTIFQSLYMYYRQFGSPGTGSFPWVHVAIRIFQPFL